MKLHSFESFNALFESSTTEPNIIIGDSGTPLLVARMKNIRILGKVGSEVNLWKGGMGVKWLKGALDMYGVSPNVKNVVINIGTNGGFNVRDDIKGLFTSLRRVFPSARFIAIQGSWGWGGNKNVTEDQVRRYYQKFSDEGAIVVNPPIGYVSTDRGAHSHLPTHDAIGKAVDSLIINQPIKTSIISNYINPNQQETQAQTDPNQAPLDIEDFQNWLDANKQGWAWGYAGGVVNRSGGYGKFGPRTTKAWGEHKDEYLDYLKNKDQSKPDVPKPIKKSIIDTPHQIGQYGKLSVASDPSSPAVFVFGGTNVLGKESGVYMYDYFNNLENRYSLFVAKNPKVPGNESYNSAINGITSKGGDPDKKILYLFSGGYLPGISILKNDGADKFDKIYLVDIWMGNYDSANFYKALANKYPSKIEYYYTLGGSVNPEAAKQIAKSVSFSKMITNANGQLNTHMATNLEAVKSLDSHI